MARLFGASIRVTRKPGTDHHAATNPRPRGEMDHVAAAEVDRTVLREPAAAQIRKALTV